MGRLHGWQKEALRKPWVLHLKVSRTRRVSLLQGLLPGTCRQLLRASRYVAQIPVHLADSDSARNDLLCLMSFGFTLFNRMEFARGGGSVLLQGNHRLAYGERLSQFVPPCLGMARTLPKRLPSEHLLQIIPHKIAPRKTPMQRPVRVALLSSKYPVASQRSHRSMRGYVQSLWVAPH